MAPVAEAQAAPNVRPQKCVAAVIQEAIEAALKVARDADEVVCEAERRVEEVLQKQGVRIIEAFKITDPLNFSTWHIVIEGMDGQPMKIEHDS